MPRYFNLTGRAVVVSASNKHFYRICTLKAYYRITKMRFHKRAHVSCCLFGGHLERRNGIKSLFHIGLPELLSLDSQCLFCGYVYASDFLEDSCVKLWQ